MNLEDKEVSLLDIIQDLERRVASLETENHELRLRVYKRFSPDEYETIYQEVMKRTARDLRLKTGAKDRA